MNRFTKAIICLAAMPLLLVALAGVAILGAVIIVLAPIIALVRPDIVKINNH